MKIALFTDIFAPGYGGLTVYVRTLAKNLLKMGHEVRVFCLENDAMTDDDHSISVTIPAISVVPKVKGKLGFAPVRLQKKINEFNPDLIHNHSQFAMGLQAIMIARHNKIPLIHHYHMYLEGSLELFPGVVQQVPRLARNVLHYENRWFFNKADHVFTPSQTMQRHLRKCDVKTAISVIPFGIDPTTFKPVERSSNRPFILLHVGRLSPEKRVRDLLPIFRAFATGKECRLVIIGNGPEKDLIHKDLIRFDLSDQVEVIEWLPREDLVSHYQNADVFVTLSEMETFGIVLLEALACGLPVIGADAGAIPDMIQDGKNGFLIPPDQTDLAGERLSTLYSDLELCQTMGREGVRIAAQFDEAVVMQQIVSEYRQLITRKNAQM